MNNQSSKILIVEPTLDGHHAFYLSLIIKAFNQYKVTLLTQIDYSALEEHCHRQEVDLAGITLIPTKSILPAEVFEQTCSLWALNSYSSVFFCYLDHYLPLLAANKVMPLKSIQGIWFHPHALDNQYKWLPPIDKRITQRRQIHRWLSDTQATVALRHIYFLDPEAPNRLNSINGNLRSCHIPDPGEREPQMSKQDARKHFNLPQDRLIFLHAGSPEKRKGLSDLIDAFYRLSRKTTWRNRALLLRIGPNDRLSTRTKKKLNQLVQDGLAELSGDYVSEDDFIEYFAASDCVVIPYRKFRFSSGILANAVMAKRPIICSNYGMIAKAVEKHNYGKCYKHRSSHALAEELERFEIHEITAAAVTAEEFITKIEKVQIRRQQQRE
jgi:glycosyltransferase involved in cell wall biosynthesis